MQSYHGIIDYISCAIYYICDLAYSYTNRLMSLLLMIPFVSFLSLFLLIDFPLIIDHVFLLLSMTGKFC